MSDTSTNDLPFVGELVMYLHDNHRARPALVSGSDEYGTIRAHVFLRPVEDGAGPVLYVADVPHDPTGTRLRSWRYATEENAPPPAPESEPAPEPTPPEQPSEAAHEEHGAPSSRAQEDAPPRDDARPADAPEP